jgi:uncharacterized membrane protein
VSRAGAPDQQRKTQAPPAAGTPIWVWVVYGLGVLAGLIFVLSVLFTAGAHFLGGSGYRTSPLAFVIWGVLLLIAVGTWVLRRRR